MVSLINSWAKGIIVGIIIATVIEIILPEGNNKKYIKTIIGIYILFIIINPLISSKKININSIIKDTTSRMDEYKIEDLRLETNQYIEEAYKTKIEEDIKEKLKNRGYNINSLKLNIETESEQLYGEVNSINIQISKIVNIENQQSNTESTVQKVDNIEINLLNEPDVEESTDKSIAEEEIKNLKEYLNNEYGTAKEKININENGG